MEEEKYQVDKGAVSLSLTELEIEDQEKIIGRRTDESTTNNIY
jgi:hypothetical protein